LDFVPCPVFWELENTTFQKLHLFPFLGELFRRDPKE
jgi:hypothetical protein